MNLIFQSKKREKSQNQESLHKSRSKSKTNDNSQGKRTPKHTGNSKAVDQLTFESIMGIFIFREIKGNKPKSIQDKNDIIPHYNLPFEAQGH